MSAVRRVLSFPRGFILLALVLLLALGLRVWAIDFGLPHVYHTDEGFEVHRALKLGAGVFDFDRVGKGGYFYLLFFVYGTVYSVLRATGSVAGTDDFLLSILRDPTAIWTIGRLTTALLGTLNCLLVFELARRTVSARAGIVAALFLAVQPLHVQSSHYITVDVPLCVCLTLCFVLMLPPDLTVPASSRRYAALGAVAALAVMTKITGAVVFVPVAAFHLTQVANQDGGKFWVKLRSDRRILWFLGTFTICYVAGNPGILLTLGETLQWAASFLSPAGTTTHLPEFPHVIDSDRSLASYYLGSLFPAHHAVALILCGWGVLAVGKDARRQHGIWFVAVYLALLVRSQSAEWVYARYVLPVVPILAVYFGAAVEDLFRRAAWRRWAAAASVLVCATALGPLAWDSVGFDRELSKADTRAAAKQWLDENVPSEAVIYIEGQGIRPSAMTAPIDPAPEVLEQMLPSLTESDGAGSLEGWYENILRQSLEGRARHRLVLTYNPAQMMAALDAREGDFAVLRKKLFAPFEEPEIQQAFPEVSRLVEWVRSDDWEEVAQFAPGPLMTGPDIRVYRKKRA